MAEPGLERLKAGLSWNCPAEHLYVASPCGLAFHSTGAGFVEVQTQRACPKNQHS